jgi:mRNA interferase MazF
VNKPARGEVWFADLRPAEGHEQDGERPVLVVSTDKFNDGPSGLIITLPITKTNRKMPSYVQLDAGHGGVKMTSYIMCEQIRCISKTRLRRLCGTVDSKVMSDVGYRLNALLDL